MAGGTQDPVTVEYGLTGRVALVTGQAATPAMMRRRWGRIVNASSYASWLPCLARGRKMW